MIPKTIHYCWFSGEKMPSDLRKCVKSWRRHFPDFELKCWDANSFDFDSAPFAKEALAHRKWAFASDYVRLYALYTEGGIYLDSDVQALGQIDEWLKYDFFTGLEMRDKEHTQIYPEAAIMGCKAGNPIIAEALDVYNNKHFILSDGAFDQTPIPTIMSPILQSHGWHPEDSTQLFEDNCIVFSTEHIANTNCERKKTVCLYHLNNMSWYRFKPLQKVWRFLKKLGLKKVLDFIRWKL